jgi:uncharacterized membrane protein YfcA
MFETLYHQRGFKWIGRKRGEATCTIAALSLADIVWGHAQPMDVLRPGLSNRCLMYWVMLLLSVAVRIWAAGNLLSDGETSTLSRHPDPGIVHAMGTIEVVSLALLIFAAAVLYSSIGHAGASGYLAAMALFGLAPAIMKPTALVLNILVATIATLRFSRAGYFAWSTLWPFAISSIPFAFAGGAINLSGGIYKPIVGLVLLLGAVRLVWPTQRQSLQYAKSVPVLPAVASGAGIGILSGLTGTGGGIFLSPLLLFMGWAETRESAGVSAAFILVNSLAGLAGNLTSMWSLPAPLPIWATAAVVGGIIGTELGSRKLASQTLRYLLAAVLVIAGLKLILT